jgi:surface protein
MSLQLQYNITGNNFTLVLPISGGTITLVDWGDGSSDNLPTHTYLNSGLYDVSIGGEAITDLNSSIGTGRNYLTECKSFGEIGLTNLNCAFYGGINLTTVPEILPSNSIITNMRNMFYGATIFNGDISNWNVSDVQDMCGIIY